MSSQNYFEVRKLAGEETLQQTTDDVQVAFRIKEVGGGTGTVTVTASDTGSTLTLVDSNAVSTVIDYDAAATDTVGKVVDTINAASGWECKILDALRSDDPDKNFTVTATAITATVVDGETVYDVLWNTDQIAAYRMRITYDRSAGNQKPKGSHRVILKSFTGNIDHTAAAQAAKIYKVVDNTETCVWKSPLTVDATATEYSFVDTSGNGITPGDGNDFVIAWDGTVVDAGANILTAQFKKE